MGSTNGDIYMFDENGNAMGTIDADNHIFDIGGTIIGYISEEIVPR